MPDTKRGKGRPRTGAMARYLYMPNDLRVVVEHEFGPDTLRVMLMLLAVKGICASVESYGAHAVALARVFMKKLHFELEERKDLLNTAWFAAELASVETAVAELTKITTRA
jgi:hypothetical protein